MSTSPSVPTLTQSPVGSPSRPMWLLVLMLAAPVLGQQILRLSVGLFDQYLAGNHTPTDGRTHEAYQAAQTTANYLAWFIASATGLVSVGATALVARFVGAKHLHMADKVVDQSMLLAVVFGLALTGVSVLILPGTVHLLGMMPDAAEICTDFLLPICLLLTFQMIESAGIACLVGAGDTKTGLWVLLLVTLLNMPLALLFYYLMGFTGIAVGTALSHVAGAVVVVLVLVRGKAGLTLTRASFRPDKAILVRLLRVSVPAMIDTVSIGVCQLWFLGLINQLGNVATAAHGIALRWEALGYLSGQAFATAAAAMVGQNLGANDPDRAARSGWLSFALGGAIMTFMGAVFFLLARPMFELFCPAPEQQAIVEMGVPVLRLVAFAMPFLSSIIILTGALRGAGDTSLPMVITWVGFLGIRIPLAYILIFDSLDLVAKGYLPAGATGLFGAWLAMFVDLLVRGACFLLRFATGGWKRIRV